VLGVVVENVYGVRYQFDDRVEALACAAFAAGQVNDQRPSSRDG
jgi:hypothetical protein